MDNENTPSSMPLLKLPFSDNLMPPIVRQIVTNAPESRKVAAMVAAMAPLCALAARVRARYYHDSSRLHALLLQVVIEGAQSAGKSFAADIEALIMNDTLKARDKVQRRIEQEYREKKRRRSQNQQMEEEPRTTIRVIPPTISKTVLTRRADLYERIMGDTTIFWRNWLRSPMLADRDTATCAPSCAQRMTWAHSSVSTSPAITPIRQSWISTSAACSAPPQPHWTNIMTARPSKVEISHAASYAPWMTA